MSKNIRFSSLNCLAVVACLGLAACSAAEVSSEEESDVVRQITEPLNLASATQTCAQDPRVVHGVVSLSVCVGAELFFRDEFGGNGRSCGSCHPADNNYTIDPTFIATLPNSDPLFVAEQVPALAGLEKPALMRSFGLILENVDGAENPTQKFTMRSVPHCLSLATSINSGSATPPLERTGWSGDGAPNLGRLKDFQTGAIFQHYTQSLSRVAGTDFVQANNAELDAIDAFMKTIGRSNELDLTTVSLTDAGAETGRGTFLSAPARCNNCHRNAGANNAAGINQLFDTGVERVRIAALNTQGIPFDGGSGGQGLANFNHDANGDGTLDSFGDGRFNATPLIEAADTGPFFHTNAFTTIEDAVTFYTTAAFTQSPSGAGGAIVLSPTQIANLGRFLRVLNAAFNVQMASARVQAVQPIIIADQNQSRDVQQELARLALVEVEDALAVLGAVSGLNASAQANLTSAKASLQTASTHASHTQRRRGAEDALVELDSADASLGTGVQFNMGEGTFMF